MQPNLVSTIIPVYNRPSMLREAVASVLAQDYRPIEVLLVDDGSTDETGAVADELAAAHPGEIRALHMANGGPGPAREAGRLQAQGEFIQYLDSDDLLLPAKFSAQVAGLRAHPECGIAYGKTAYGQKMTVPWKRTGESIPTLWPSILKERWWGTSTPLYRRAITDAAPGWEALRQEEDWVYDCRIATKGVLLHYCDAFLSHERENAPARLSGNIASGSYWHDRAAAHRLIWEAVLALGPDCEQPEQRHFARELFLLARQCGAAGLAEESQTLFILAREASSPERVRGCDFRLYGLAAGMLGWDRVGRLACTLDKLRA